jgi:hypothetical protein
VVIRRVAPGWDDEKVMAGLLPSQRLADAPSGTGMTGCALAAVSQYRSMKRAWDIKALHPLDK